jgi:hypothetical protein
MSQFYESLDETTHYNEFYLNDYSDAGIKVTVENNDPSDGDDTSIYSNSKGYDRNMPEFELRNYPKEDRRYGRERQYSNKKYDMDIVNRLMDYIELSMQKRLNAIEKYQ